MIKLSVAVALLMGANAIATDTKADLAAMSADKKDAKIDFLSAISAIPPPDEEKEQVVLNYWKDDEFCYDLFMQIIEHRKTIKTTIEEYQNLIALYHEKCKIPT